MTFFLRAAAALALFSVPAFAQEVQLTGTGGAAITLSPQTLSAYPQHDQDIAFMSSKGEEKGHYRGVLLWDILAAHSQAAADTKPMLKNVLLVTAKDGHHVAFSVGEIAPEFGAKPVMLATERDGQPMDQGLRIVVPGDKRGARNIRDVTTIELR